MINRTPKPTVLVIPGSFSPATLYYGIIEDLKASGFEAFVYDLPSASRLPPQEAATLAEDAAYFHGKAEKLTDEGREVVLVAHSYGGIVASECVKGLSEADRQAASKPGAVIRIIYLTSVIAPLGDSLRSVCGDGLPAFLRLDGDFMYHEIDGSAAVNFSDLPQEQGVKFAMKMSRHSGPSFNGRATFPGYRRIPSTYIFTEKDEVLVPEFQQRMINFLEKETGEKANVVRIDTGHCPNASAPEKVAASVREILGYC